MIPSWKDVVVSQGIDKLLKDDFNREYVFWQKKAVGISNVVSIGRALHHYALSWNRKQFRTSF